MIAIAACDPEGVIGCDGRLPWDEPDDLHHFRTMTRHGFLILGRKTFNSMPPKAFEERDAVVLSRTLPEGVLNHKVRISNTLETCMSNIDLKMNQQLFVCGGQSIFEIFFAQGLVTKTILTRLHQRYKGDTFFPLHALQEWHRIDRQHHPRFVIETWVPAS